MTDDERLSNQKASLDALWGELADLRKRLDDATRRLDRVADVVTTACRPRASVSAATPSPSNSMQPTQPSTPSHKPSTTPSPLPENVETESAEA